MPRRFSRVASSSRAFASRLVTVPFRQSQRLRRLRVRLPAQVAEQHHLAQRQRHSGEFLVDDRPEIVLGFRRVHPFGFGRCHFSQPPLNDLASEFLRDAQCDAVQPRADAAIQLQRVGPPGEDEEDRLEGVVGIGPVAEDPLAGPVHEGAVSADESSRTHPRRGRSGTA